MDFPQLHAADKLIHLSCKTINRFLDNENLVDIETKQLIKAKLSKIQRLDSQNLPILKEALLNKMSDASDK